MNLRNRILRLQRDQDRRRRAAYGWPSRWVEQAPGEPLEAFLARLRDTRARLVRLAAHEPAESADRVAKAVSGVQFLTFAAPSDTGEWERRAAAPLCRSKPEGTGLPTTAKCGHECEGCKCRD